MQKVAEPSRRSGAVTEYLARARVGTRSKCPRGSSPRAKLESQLQQLREQSERREVESAELRARLAALEGAEKKG